MRKICLLLIITVLVACMPQNKDQQQIKVGAILPLSGEFAFLGEQFQSGMEMAVSELKDKNLKIVYEDDRSLDSKAALSGLRKLITVDEVALVFNPYVNTVKALASTFNDEKVPGVVIWDSNEVIESLGDYVYSMGFSTELAGADMAEFAHNDLGISNVSVISVHDEWSEIISGAFIEKFEELGGSIDLRKRVDVTEEDLKTIISEIKKKESGAIYMPLYFKSFHAMVRQSKELGYEGQLLSGDGVFDSDIKDLGMAAEGMYFSQPWIMDLEFKSKYQDFIGEEASPLSMTFAAMAYDAINFYVELCDFLETKDLEVSSENIHKNIKGFEFEGVIAKTTIGESNVANKKERILVVKNGKFELVK